MTSKPPSAFFKGPALRIAGSLLTIGLLVTFAHLHKLAAALHNVPAILWVSVVLGYLLTHVIGVLKWRLTLRLSQARLTIDRALRCYFAGLFGTAFLPSIVGGDVIRMALAFRTEQNKAAILLGSLVDRLLDMIALGLVAGIGILLLPGALDARSRRTFSFLVVFFIVAIGALAALIFITPFGRLPYKARRLFAKIRRAGNSMASKPAYVLLSLLLGLTVQTNLVALSASIATACGLHISFHIWLLVWPLTKLLALAPITLGGLGIREAGLTALLAPFGAPIALTVATGLVWESVIIVGGLLAGLVSFLLGGTAFKQTTNRFTTWIQELRVPPVETSR